MVCSLDDSLSVYANDADVSSLLEVLLSYWFDPTRWKRLEPMEFAAHSKE